jgi:hypothetical protein
MIQYALGYVFFLRDWDSYFLDSRLLGHGHKSVNVGADYNHSVYWTFISSDLYNSHWFTDRLKLAILALNTYYFFIRQWCLPQCLYHVLGFKLKLIRPDDLTVQEQDKKVIEIMVVGLLIGAVNVPGGHR